MLLVLVHRHRGRRCTRQALLLDDPAAIDKVRHAEFALSLLRHFPARERGRLSDRERRLVFTPHNAHHGQGGRQLLWVAGAAAAGGAPLDDVGAASPELAVDGDEAGRLEPCRRGEDVEPERRLDHELLRVRAAQDYVGGVHARVEHIPNPVGCDGEEMLPGTVPAAEKEGGDDKETGHSLALRVAPCGGRVEILAYSLVGLVRI